MGLERIQQTYEQFGREAPFFAVVTARQYRDKEFNIDEFYALGRQEIARVLDEVEAAGMTLGRQRALDFGCGVGRLSQALCEYFDEVVGVDIAESMVASAKAHNRFGDRCRYVVNVRDDLEQLESDSFDFIYSNITLQHIPPEHSQRYIREFFRVLRPEGAVVFQVPTGPEYRQGGAGQRLYRLHRELLRPLWKRVRGKPAVEIHYVPQSRVEQIVDQCCGHLAWIDHENTRKRVKEVRYFATKRAA